MYTHTFNLPVGASPVQVNASGTYLRYVSAASGVTNPKVRVKPDSGDAFDLLPGQAIRLPRRASFFSLLNVDGISTITGVLVIGDGEMDDSRVTGEVLMIDGSYSRSLASRAASADDSLAGAAGQYSHVGIENNSGGLTAFNMIVHTLRCWALVAGTYTLRLNYLTVPLTAGANGVNKLAGAPSVWGRAQKQNLGVITGFQMMRLTADPTMREVKLQDPIILRPTYGLCLVPEVVNVGIAAGFDYYIEPV